MRARPAAFALAFAACAASVRSTPRPAAVTPAQGEDDRAVTLSVAGDFAPSTTADFSNAARSALDATFALALVPSTGAPVSLGSAALAADGTLAATVPAGVARGLYGVSVTDAAGRTGLLPDVYRVVRAASHVARFDVAPLGPQRVGVAFAVRVTAVDDAGARVDGFSGDVALSDAAGAATPARLGPFALGRLRAQVTVAAASSAEVISVKDDAGHAGASAPFPVGAGRPSVAAFTGLPTSLAAGACSSALGVELRDAAGLAVSGVSMQATLTAAPPEHAALFADAACATPLAALTLAPRAAFYVRATVAGAFTLRVLPDTLPSARAQLVTTALAPSRVAFATPSPALGPSACSPPLELAAEDAFGNESAPAANVALTLASRPAGALAFFGDTACATPPPAALAAGQSRARFFVKAAVAGNARVDADAGPLGGDAQDLAVGP